MINDTFKEIFGLQFVCSAILISINIFLLSTEEFELINTLLNIVYTLVLLLDLFIYCLAANEVRFKVRY